MADEAGAVIPNGDGDGDGDGGAVGGKEDDGTFTVAVAAAVADEEDARDDDDEEEEEEDDGEEKRDDVDVDDEEKEGDDGAKRLGVAEDAVLDGRESAFAPAGSDGAQLRTKATVGPCASFSSVASLALERRLMEPFSSLRRRRSVYSSSSWRVRFSPILIGGDSVRTTAAIQPPGPIRTATSKKN